MWLIAHYEYCKSEIEKIENIDTIRSFCKDEEVDLGTCNAAKKQFGTGIYDKRWVTKYGLFYWSFYWCKTPERCNTKKEIIGTFKTRLGILVKELELC